MAITRNTGALIGTSETTGITLNNVSTPYYTGATGGGNFGLVTTDIDVLTDNASVADAWFYFAYTSAQNAGTFDITILTHRVTGQGYTKAQPDFQIACVSPSGLIALGKKPIARYLAGSIVNNGTGATATNVSLLYEYEKLT